MFEKSNVLFTSYSDLSQPEGRRYKGGKGAYLFISDGLKIMDGLSGSMNANLGHGNEAIARHMLDQAQNMCALPAIGNEFSESSYELANQIKELLTPGVGSTTFCSSGSEATETALALTWTYWNRLGCPRKRLILSQDASYHGCTMGALSVTGRMDEWYDVGDILPRIRIGLPAWSLSDPLGSVDIW